MNYGNIDNVKSGPCIIFEDDGSGERAVGLTFGDVVFAANPQYRDRNFHQYGDTPVDKVLQNMAGSVRFSAAETTKENLQLALPLSVLYTDGTKKTIGVGARNGTSIKDKARKLRIHPINKLGANGIDDPTYLEDDITVWKAASMEAFDRTLSASTDRQYDINMGILVDDSKPDDYNMWVEGDPSVTGQDTTAPEVETVKAEVADSLTLVPADAAGLTNVDADATIEIVFTEEIRSQMAVQKYVSVLLDSDKSIVAGTFVHSVVAGSPNKSKVVFTPGSAFSASTAYQIVIGGIEDISRNVMTGITQRKFTTAA